MTDTIPFDTVIARAIDALRRQMLDDGSIGQYLLALLMVKYASDFTSVLHASSSGSFAIADTARFNHLLQNAKQPGNASRIADALLQVEKANAALVSEALRGPLFSHSDRDSPHAVNRSMALRCCSPNSPPNYSLLLGSQSHATGSATVSHYFDWLLVNG